MQVNDNDQICIQESALVTVRLKYVSKLILNSGQLTRWLLMPFSEIGNTVERTGFGGTEEMSKTS